MNLLQLPPSLNIKQDKRERIFKIKGNIRERLSYSDAGCYKERNLDN